ncbi:MAG: HAD-IC family P-type ATPase [Oscillospiraceae bacterium]|nr:HAD-IC family P-type ATPase [Oscillospiraceae bacterium]
MNNIKRHHPQPTSGLNNEQVKERINKGLTNISTSVPTKTFSKIFIDNFFTLFNGINLILALAIIFVGSYKNALFMGVVLSNLIIGTFQEIRAKKAVDSLSLLSSKKTKVLRNSKEYLVNLDEIVLDDILVLKAGDQIPTDCIVCSGECEVNESLLTGESDSILKEEFSHLLSGSFIISGQCKARADKVGKENYISKISKSAKYVKKVDSKISDAFNKIMLAISVIIIPVGALLFLKQLKLPNNSVQKAVVNTVAALIGMIPEGLVLLTSTVLAISVIRLSKRKVLVQELYCIETLARIDTLCLDKTGTITKGTMELSKIITCQKHKESEVEEALKLLSYNLKGKDPTFLAISSKYFSKNAKTASKVIHFSSERKWSGIYFEGLYSIILGAPEFVLGNKVSKFKDEIEKHTQDNRVLVVAKSNENFIETEENKFSLPKEKIDVLGFVLIKDKIRKNAKKTLEYFKNQGVDLKIISGDNALTVSSVARAVGFDKSSKYIDMSSVNDSNIKDVALNYSIFGRVSPMQKKQLVSALKKHGKTVAMTGDGVNDVMALKESDCSIAMASGSEAARNISQIVLLNSDFSTMPKILNEGRRSINNIQRSSSLFLVKTIYSCLLAIVFLFVKMPYPFSPIQMTLTTSLTIGIPSFFLALEPNNERVCGSFLLNIISKSVPGALAVVINVILSNLVAYYFHLETWSFSTISVILTTFTGFLILYNVCLPFDLPRKIIFTSVLTCYIIAVLAPKTKEFFYIARLSFEEIFILLSLIIVSFFIFRGITDVFKLFLKTNVKK